MFSSPFCCPYLRPDCLREKYFGPICNTSSVHLLVVTFKIITDHRPSDVTANTAKGLIAEVKFENHFLILRRLSHNVVVSVTSFCNAHISGKYVHAQIHTYILKGPPPEDSSCVGKMSRKQLCATFLRARVLHSRGSKNARACT